MPALGIMTHRIHIGNIDRYISYAKEAERLGFYSTVLFTPNHIQFNARKVRGYKYRHGQWSPCVASFPAVIHDMGFYTKGSTIRKVKQMKNDESVRFTGYALGSKWQIHSRLLQTKYAPYLPATKLFLSPSDVAAMMKRYGAVIVKPKNGKKGQGIVKISLRGNQEKAYLWKEGDYPAAWLTPRQLARMLRKRFRPQQALVQRWMDITCSEGRVYDIRALVQKEYDEGWRLTEMAVRQSGQGRIASNVAGGGVIRDVIPFLTPIYGEETAKKISEECEEVALGVSAALEEQYGKPLIELGIDLAIERGGWVRMIEVNIKPGKKIVRALSGEKAYADALLRPIRFAKQLSDRRDCLSKGL
jgi:hypothetical protein